MHFESVDSNQNDKLEIDEFWQFLNIGYKNCSKVEADLLFNAISGHKDYVSFADI
jgi:hypothetical protein